MVTCRGGIRRSLVRSASLIVAIVSLAALALGVTDVRAAVTCPQGTLLIPYASTAAGSETHGDCIPVRTGPNGRTRVDARYSDVATKVIDRFAGLRGIESRDSLVVCWSSRDWKALDRKQRQQGGDGLGNLVGFVYFPWNVINLSPSTCRELDRVTFDGGEANGNSAFQITTLAHEALHVAGIENEARTECFAIQMTADTAGLLGLGDSVARDVAKDSHAAYPEYGKQNPDYWTPNCRNGTGLDLRPGTPRFP